MTCAGYRVRRCAHGPLVIAAATAARAGDPPADTALAQPAATDRAGRAHRARRPHDDGRRRRRALRAGGRADAARGGAGRDLVADAPRAPGAHVLALSVALHAGPHPREVRRGRARGRAADAAVRAAALPRAGVRDGRARAASCAGGSPAACSSRAPRTAATATCRSRSSAARRSTATTARVRVEVEVANFYPALASAVARWLYSATQSRIHVIVTHGFLRSLARLDLAESKSWGATPRPTTSTTCPIRRRARRARPAARAELRLRAAARPPRTAGIGGCCPKTVARARASVRWQPATPGACCAR